MTLWEQFRLCFIDGSQAPQKAYFLFQRSTEHFRQELLTEAQQEQHGDQPIMEFLTERVKQLVGAGLVSDQKTQEELARSNQILEQRRQQIEAGTYVAPPSMADQLRTMLGPGWNNEHEVNGLGGD